MITWRSTRHTRRSWSSSASLSCWSRPGSGRRSSSGSRAGSPFAVGAGGADGPIATNPRLSAHPRRAVLPSEVRDLRQVRQHRRRARGASATRSVMSTPGDEGHRVLVQVAVHRGLAVGGAGRRRSAPARHLPIPSTSPARTLRLRSPAPACRHHGQAPLKSSFVSCLSLLLSGHLVHRAAHPSLHELGEPSGDAARRNAVDTRWRRLGRHGILGAVDPDVAITIVFCFLVALVALGGGYLVRYETRRDRRTIRR